MRTLGICVGATTIQYVQLSGEAQLAALEANGRIVHEGNPAGVLVDLLGRLDTVALDRVAVTGRAFRASVNLTAIHEPQAVERALATQCAGRAFPDVVVSSGGETQMVYRIGADGVIASVHTGNKCASGTGEFFLQQIRRMGLSLEEAVALAQEGEPHRIAGRCSVFCKSDCTHALNKGAAKADVAAGLCLMMAEKVRDLVKETACERMLLIGGGSLNGALLRFLRRSFPSVETGANSAVFEAWGAALWALENPCRPLPARLADVVHSGGRSFAGHPPLSAAQALVEFRPARRAAAQPGDLCILGLDVGSTTTKAVLLRRSDDAVLASVYLRTSGDPVNASRQCYRAIAAQVNGVPLRIEALGVTGSGRQIAGLHALSDNVINEIIAHATAAAYYDPQVDTIFEIGGQDAKYTYLTAGVPSDYAMNEACSAGTGSFLEEAAAESLGVAVERIADCALAGASPPDFRDECAAFIGSDIKVAGQEGVGRDDILAGLVYSICLNYLNRVKGSRPVGHRVFMQGGVCYNRAVPIAMAACLRSPIVVPPEPGLMGALGVALEVKKRLDAGLAQPGSYDLAELAGREVTAEEGFTCGGGSEKCDRRCHVNRYRVNGTVYPFGGACDRWYNQRLHRPVDASVLDYVARRQRLLFEESAPRADLPEGSRSVGLSRSLMMHSLYPLFSHFFAGLGLRPVLSDGLDAEGYAAAEASFCLPALAGHASFANLLRKKLDYIFVPHLLQLPVPNVPTFSRLCPFVQAEPYYLRTTFREQLESSTTVVLSPVLRMEEGYGQAAEAMAAMAQRLGVTPAAARRAWQQACERQSAFEAGVRALGAEALAHLEQHPEHLGIVVFGRPYNAFSGDINMGVPHKIASRGCVVIPHDALPADHHAVDRKMFWATGQRIMKAAAYVKDRPNLFGVYMTSFSCGPDSFLLTYFRDLMAGKPSLTLELDQHTANAGIDTRIEAALDIMHAYRRPGAPRPRPAEHVRAARVEEHDGSLTVLSSEGERLPLTHPRVEVVIPSMGFYGTQALAAVMRGEGIAARALPVADREALQMARRNASCKECLPYLVTLGSFLAYLQTRSDASKVTLCFLPTGGGPCRLGQYCRAVEAVFRRLRLRNTAVLTLTDENGYAGLGARALLRGWQGIATADVLEDVRSFVSVAAVDPAAGLGEVDACWREITTWLEGRSSVRYIILLSLLAERLARIGLRRGLHEVPVVSVVGEYYVRKDLFSRRNLVDYLQAQGFMVKVAPAIEYLCYSNRNILRGLQEGRLSPLRRLQTVVQARLQGWWEQRIKSAIAQSGLYRFEMTDVDRTMDSATHLISEQFRGEAVLTVGLALREILDESCGVVAIGPFGCMPSRVAEAVLRREMNGAGKRRMAEPGPFAEAFVPDDEFPFLSVETDGNPFPQVVQANLEAFVLRARRLHRRLAELQGRRVAEEAAPGPGRPVEVA